MPKREDMRKHFAEAQVEHAMLVAGDLADLRAENEELHADNEELKQDYEEPRTDRDALKDKITALTERTQEILAAPKAIICWVIEDWAAKLAGLRQTRDPLYSSVVPASTSAAPSSMAGASSAGAWWAAMVYATARARDS